MTRPIRIAAVTAITAILVTTTGVGIVAVTQAFGPDQRAAVLSDEAITSTPVTLEPVTATAATVPDVGTQPSLPAIDDLLTSTAATATAPAVRSSPTTSASTSRPSAVSGPSTGSSRTQGHRVSEHEDEHESDD